MQCGQHIVTINPYVWSKRRKTYADMCRAWDQRFDKFAAQIDSVYLMSGDNDIEQVPWSYEDMFAVIGLSTDALERATMVRGFLDDSIRMRPAFPRPEKREVIAT